jgi:hypothetical protein
MVRWDSHVRTPRDLFDIEGSDRVTSDVSNVGRVPIEALDLSHPIV